MPRWEQPEPRSPVKCKECSWMVKGCLCRMSMRTYVNLCLWSQCTISVKLEWFFFFFLLEGWLSWGMSKVKHWCHVTYLDEWSPPSGMSASAIPSFYYSFSFNLLFGVTTASPHFNGLKSLTDVSSLRYTNLFCCWKWQSRLSCWVQNEFKVISIFSFDNLHCTDVSTVLL